MIKSLISKILFVIGIIIILIILAWAIIHFVPAIFNGLANVGSSIGNVFQNKNKAIEVTVNDNELINGEEFNVQWKLKKTDTEQGRYSITYSCVENLSFEIKIEGDTTKKLICNTPFTIKEGVYNANIKTIYTKENSFEDVDLIVYFTEEGESDYKYAGKTTLTVKNSSDNNDVPETAENSEGDLSASELTGEPVVESQETTPTTSGQSTQTKKTTYYSSPADLAISNIVSIPNRSTVQFTVSNIGGRNSGNWQLAYNTPTYPKITEYSPLQRSLAPGQSLRFTLSFTEQYSDRETITIIVDSGKVVSEISENNNIATATVTGPTNNNGYDPDTEADLEIVYAKIGRMSGNRFIEDDRIYDGDDAVLNFRVANRGGEATGSWEFEVTNTPFDSDDDYQSGRQTSLRPNEYVDIYVDFDNVDEGDYRMRVEVDSDDDVEEESESNNTETVNLEVRD